MPATLLLINARFAPARERKKELLANPEHIRDLLRQGAEKAREKGARTLTLARERVGLGY